MTYLKIPRQKFLKNLKKEFNENGDKNSLLFGSYDSNDEYSFTLDLNIISLEIFDEYIKAKEYLSNFKEDFVNSLNLGDLERITAITVGELSSKNYPLKHELKPSDMVDCLLEIPFDDFIFVNCDEILKNDVIVISMYDIHVIQETLHRAKVLKKICCEKK